MMKHLKYLSKENMTCYQKIWKPAFLLLIFTILIKNTNAQDNFPSGARASAMSNAATVLTDVWANYHNQACLGFYNELTFGYHYENKFILDDFAQQSLAAAIPTGRGTIGVNLTFYGSAKFNESKIALAFGKPFGEKFAAGIQLDLLNVHQANDYGNASTLAVEGGMLFRPVENWSLGIHVYNPAGASFKSLTDEKIPVIIEAGTGWKPGDKILIVAEAEKNFDQALIIKAGAEYKVIESIYARIGVSTYKYSSYSFGVGFAQKRINADIAFSHHIILGFTPHISMSYSL